MSWRWFTGRKNLKAANGGGRQEVRKRKNLRYAICSQCREKWNVAKTRPIGRYICPRCRTEQKKKGAKNEGANENSGQNT